MKKYTLKVISLMILSSALLLVAGCATDEAVILPDREVIISQETISNEESDRDGVIPQEDNGTGSIVPQNKDNGAGNTDVLNKDNGAGNSDTQNKDNDAGRTGFGEEDDYSAISRVTVYVCGAVVNPGVYTLDPEARIVDAVEMAGGMNEEADPDYINQALLLTDGTRIYIPTRSETSELSPLKEYGQASVNPGAGGVPGKQVLSSQGQDENSAGIVNINTGSLQELMTLPGIGEAKAGLIIEYRESNGGFARIEDIMKINGIKEGMFNKIKDRISI
ncbi:MAG: helix-hairpin-helix domain-containing protein [Lachnospiraceae bacterium]|nr:helix-hairpin-helix domain-containing protein [Lachnospiraceae bacterium]